MVIANNMKSIAALKSFRERPFIIAGPCSAETEEQIMNTARQLAETAKVAVFRAGVWKPRTRPNGFEGVGVNGLKWLKQVKHEFNLPVGTEVATQNHVHEALKYGIDVLWIGARTSADPFAVQEIADALHGVDVTVLIKNPVNPDLELWIGAIERVHEAGINTIGVIHRGFSSYEKTRYRNLPKWQMPIELIRRIPGLPIICDPSHIAGDTLYLHEISQKAIDLNYDGLMIETHIDPAHAWSDAQQQITPNELVDLLGRLIMRAPRSTDNKFLDLLSELRTQIDMYDDQLLDLMEQRMKVAETIGKYKKENDITILQTSRWDQIIRKAIEKGGKKGLSAEFIDKLFKSIHEESINHQMKVMNK
jgi:chorismate mutase